MREEITQLKPIDSDQQKLEYAYIDKVSLCKCPIEMHSVPS
jgi:hypothetical protein